LRIAIQGGFITTRGTRKRVAINKLPIWNLKFLNGRNSETWQRSGFIGKILKNLSFKIMESQNGQTELNYSPNTETCFSKRLRKPKPCRGRTELQPIRNFIFQNEEKGGKNVRRKLIVANKGTCLSKTDKEKAKRGAENWLLTNTRKN